MMSLFPEKEDEFRKSMIGNSKVEYKKVSSILTRATGFMNTYDFTLNPYSGCSFGCTYCYAAFFSKSEELKATWGYWIHAKENALHLLTRFRKRPLHGKAIYMSSVTDPYMPIEKDLLITRSLLKELADFHQPRLVIQTRSPLVTRDIDLLQRFKSVQVNMTVTTDSEDVRKIFEPLCPSNTVRMKAIKEVNDAGINSCITMTPLLPVEDAEKFASNLKATGVKNFIVQPFHSDRGKFVAGTRDSAMQLIRKMEWNKDKYKKVESVLVKHIPEIGIGKEGFKPIK